MAAVDPHLSTTQPQYFCCGVQSRSKRGENNFLAPTCEIRFIEAASGLGKHRETKVTLDPLNVTP